jgi:alcohol dehydrogenase class IV
VTRNAVLFSEAERVKVSLRHPGMLPSMAMVDPALTLGLPPDLTAHTGMDALTQVLEPFVSCRANPVTDAFCRRGLEGASWALQRAFANGEDQAAREEMALVSLLGGLALANAGLGAVHGFAAPLGGWMKAPHGAICAGLLPHVMEMNIRVLRARQPQHPALERYREVATILTRRAEAAPEDGVEWVRALSHRLGVPRLGTFGLKEEEIEYLALLSERASSMRGNPLPLDRPELAAVLRAAR